MATESLKIDKFAQAISLWIHPEGMVKGSIFLIPDSPSTTGESTEDALNQSDPFLVVKTENLEQIRFYNRASIIRAETDKLDATPSDTSHRYVCKLNMMDGTEIEGVVQESLPKKYSRLYDYLNKKSERFIKLYSDTTIYYINKSYITQIRSEDC